MKLHAFNTANLFEAATDLFQQLEIQLNSNTTQSLSIKEILLPSGNYKDNDTFRAVSEAYFIGVIEDSVFKASGLPKVRYTYEEFISKNDPNYEGLMIFALGLTKQPTRTEIAELARAFNRASEVAPVALVLKYNVGDEAVISIAITERFKYQQEWRRGERAGKAIILRDIHTKTPHAGHLRILLDLRVPDTITNYEQLYKHWLEVLDLNILNQKFYQELSNWYFWAMQVVSFPDDIEKNKEVRIATSLIRLITRIIFIWFLKEKDLVLESLFNEKFVTKKIKEFNKHEKCSNYYKAILQNLFFAVLNNKIKERRFVGKDDMLPNGKDSKIKYFFHYLDLFNDTEQEVLRLFEYIPMVNGGLFQCADQLDENGDILYVDGFSLNPEKQAFVPDYLFFSPKRAVDLNKVYGTQNKTYYVRGLIDILKSYKFTVAENTSLEEEIALDPELLGKVFENLLASYNPETQTTARKQTGSFYTPREVVDYIITESLFEYLKHNVKSEDQDFEKKLRDLLSYSNDSNPFDEKKTKEIVQAINNCKILDPSCGSGAFLMSAVNKINHVLRTLDPSNKYWRKLQRDLALEQSDAKERKRRLDEIDDIFENNSSDYARKFYVIKNCIYGIDIQPIAVQIAKLRLFISLIIDQIIDKDKENLGIRCLPNLETNFVAADTLINLYSSKQLTFRNPEIEDKENQLRALFDKYFETSDTKEKIEIQELDKKLRQEIAKIQKNDGWDEELTKNIIAYNPYDQNKRAHWFDIKYMFRIKTKFDIVIGNPPYVSTKMIDENYKKELQKQYGFGDDLYNHFYHKGIELLKENGILAYISSKTFWTIQTKRNIRDLLLRNTILQIVDTANPFKSVMVDTCIIIVQKTPPPDNHIITFIDGRENLSSPQKYLVNQSVYASSPNQVFFVPNEYNLSIYKKLGKKANELLQQWWNIVSTSKNIDKNKAKLEQYRQSLKPGDITLLGLITEGGVGMQTGDNGKYIGVLDGTKWADNVRKQRSERLLLATEFCKKQNIKSKQEAQKFLETFQEKEIRKMFDNLKEKYGRDIFGQGWIYRIISKDEIADVEKLTEHEKLNGIVGAKTFVPYDKGDKEGNRWYAPTPYYIDWSSENVNFIKGNREKKGVGMPIMRNPQFYFREGFCWNIIGMNTIKVRLKDKTVNDVASMSLYPTNADYLKYIVVVLNSSFMSHYQFNFVNSTVNIQMNDIRQLPIIIPTNEQLKVFDSIFDKAYDIQKQKFEERISHEEAEQKLAEIQVELDRLVEEMYMKSYRA